MWFLHFSALLTTITLLFRSNRHRCRVTKCNENVTKSAKRDLFRYSNFSALKVVFLFSEKHENAASNALENNRETDAGAEHQNDAPGGCIQPYGRAKILIDGHAGFEHTDSSHRCMAPTLSHENPQQPDPVQPAASG
jgi:hypothetical protein